MQRYVAFDVETPNEMNHRISAIGITVIEDGQIVHDFYSLVNPETRFAPFNIRLTGITPEQAAAAPSFPVLWPRIAPLLENGTLVAHNARFDLSVLGTCLRDYGIVWQKNVPYLCTVQMGRKILPGMSHRLNVLCDFYGIDLNHHHADSDSHACAELLLRYLKGGEEPDNYLQTWTFSFSKADIRTQACPENAAGEPAKAAAASAENAAGAESSGIAGALASAREILQNVYGRASFREDQS